MFLTEFFHYCYTMVLKLEIVERSALYIIYVGGESRLYSLETMTNLPY